MSLRKGREDADDRADRCQWVRCRRAATIIYLKDGLCWGHWEKLCAQQAARGGKPPELVEVPA